jgi:alpha-N-acetylglucosamine transferase
LLENLIQWAREVLILNGAQVYEAEDVPYNFIGAPVYARGKWKQAVIKLRMFQMTQFEKVVFLGLQTFFKSFFFVLTAFKRCGYFGAEKH